MLPKDYGQNLSQDTSCGNDISNSHPFDVNKPSILDGHVNVTYEHRFSHLISSGITSKVPDVEDNSNNRVVKQSIGNLLWMLTMLQIITAISVISENTFKKKKTDYQLAFHICTFLLGMLCVERFGPEMHTLYLHELMYHLTKQLEKRRLTLSGTDKFEGFFAPLKKQYQKGCHRKDEADRHVTIKRNGQSQLGLLLPQFVKSNNNSKISEWLETFELKNIFIPKELIVSSDIHKKSFEAKLKELYQVFPTTKFLGEKSISDIVVIREDG